MAHSLHAAGFRASGAKDNGHLAGRRLDRIKLNDGLPGGLAGKMLGGFS